MVQGNARWELLVDGTPTHICPIRAGAGGLISVDWCIDKFATTLAELPSELTESEIMRPDLQLWSDHGWSIYYVPFERVNPAARILLVGLTPGRHQMWRANMAAAQAIRAGRSIPEVLDAASRSGAFAGTMRRNLVQMLDDIGVAKWLGLQTTEVIWTDDSAFELESGTSAVLHPLFKAGGANYGGNVVTDAVRFPVLGAFLDQVLAAELALVPDALIVPLGVSVNGALTRLISAGSVERQRVLEGFPHPSGANGHMRPMFELHKEHLAERVASWSDSHPF